MKCLDTYALVEIAEGNPVFMRFLADVVINDITLAEFYYLLYGKYGLQAAEYWQRKFEHCTQPVGRPVLIQAVRFRQDNKKFGLSFFDCVGYIFSRTNGLAFVTGDQAFKNLEGVEFITR